MIAKIKMLKMRQFVIFGKQVKFDATTIKCFTVGHPHVTAQDADWLWGWGLIIILIHGPSFHLLPRQFYDGLKHVLW